MEQLLEREWWLGGENSGHVICRNLVTTGDAIVAALQVLAVVSRSGKSLDILVSDMPMMPQILINVRYSVSDSDGENQPLESELVKAAVVDAEKAMEVGTDTPKGRILLRKSGTEPLIRMMAEAETAEMAQQWAEHIADAVKAV